MTILLTGGAGFIGSNLVRQALERTDDLVVVFDKLTYAGSLENLEEVKEHPRYRFVQGDIANSADVQSVFAEHQPTAVLNLAAESHVDRSIDGPGAFVETNIVGTFELLDAARAHVAKLRGTDQEAADSFRFLHVSTDEVFGSLGPEGAFSETTAYDPSSPYSASKAAADHLVRAYGRTYGMNTVVTNCSNNYGPFQFPEKLIPLMILNASEGKDLPIYGDGTNIRDWLHVEDHCSGILQVLKRGDSGESYNIGGNSERSNLQVVDALCAALEQELPNNPALGKRGYERYEQLVTFVKDRPGHDQRYAIDASKIERDLDWVPSHNFEEGLRQTVRWYLDHRDWCASVTDDTSRERIGTKA